MSISRLCLNSSNRCRIILRNRSLKFSSKHLLSLRNSSSKTTHSSNSWITMSDDQACSNQTTSLKSVCHLHMSARKRKILPGVQVTMSHKTLWTLLIKAITRDILPEGSQSQPQVLWIVLGTVSHHSHSLNHVRILQDHNLLLIIISSRTLVMIINNRTTLHQKAQLLLTHQLPIKALTLFSTTSRT